MIIIGGLKRNLQPFNVSINKPFKEKSEESTMSIVLKNANIKVSKKIDWVDEIWYCGKLTSAVISKSYKRTWVSLNLGGGEDKLFISFNKED